MTYPAPPNQRQHSTTKKLLKKTSLVGNSSTEKDSRFGHSATSSNLHQGTLSVSENTLGSEKCTPTHIQRTPVSIRDQHNQKRRKDPENVNIPQKRKRSSQKEESPAGNTKNSYSNFPLEEGSK